MLFAGENLHTPRPLSRLVEYRQVHFQQQHVSLLQQQTQYMSLLQQQQVSLVQQQTQYMSRLQQQVAIGASMPSLVLAWTLRMGTVKPQVQSCRSVLQSGVRAAPTEYSATSWGLKRKACGLNSHRLKQLRGTQESTSNQQKHRHTEQADPSEEG